MKERNLFRLLGSGLRTVSILALAAGTLLPVLLLAGSETKTEKTPGNETPAEQKTNTVSSLPKQQAPPKKLTGAELYSMHCNRCHPERYPTERTAAQWKTILMHMRVRANLPAEQARTILKYLQDNSGR
jgi:hypothetical protein